MAAGRFDAANLLATVKILLGRPSVDDALPDSTVLYPFLTMGQDRAFQDLSTRAPKAMMGPPVLLTTADSGKTYTFGSDTSLADTYTEVWPAGHLQVYASLEAIPDEPLFEGLDYLSEGVRIRIPGNATRSFASGPYARFLTPPSTIDGTHAPTLRPVYARQLIVLEACRLSAGTLRRDQDTWERQYGQALIRILLQMKTQDANRAAGRTAGDNSSAAFGVFDVQG